MWNATCPDTYVPSYSLSATSGAGTVAALAEEKKEAKYISLSSIHTFTHVAIETSGVFSPKFLHFIQELGSHVMCATGEMNSTNYLKQRLSNVSVRLLSLVTWATRLPFVTFFHVLFCFNSH